LWQFYIGLIKLKDFKLEPRSICGKLTAVNPTLDLGSSASAIGITALEPVTVFTEASKVDILRGVLLLLLGQAERKLGRLNQQW